MRIIHLCSRSATIIAACLIFGSFSKLVFAQINPIGATIEFKDHGKLIKSLQPSELGAVVAKQSLKIYESHEKKEREYNAYPARPLFDQIFGESWKIAEEVVFLSADGYQPSIPVKKFLTHDAYFAFANADGSPFILTNLLQDNETVELGPLYLVWDNLQSTVLRNEGASDMPYQIVGIELTSFAMRFSKLIPPTDASPLAKQGFLHFRKHCLACHTINGQGGGKAPELNYPVSVTEYIKPEYLRRWIEQPSSIRYNTTMPALEADTPQREEVIDAIIAYLKVMRFAKGI